METVSPSDLEELAGLDEDAPCFNKDTGCGNPAAWVQVSLVIGMWADGTSGPILKCDPCKAAYIRDNVMASRHQVRFYPL